MLLTTPAAPRFLVSELVPTAHACPARPSAEWVGAGLYA